MRSSINVTRNNHYVPEWYQRGFLTSESNELVYLDLSPDTKKLPDGRVITMNSRSSRPTSKCFRQRDVYTTFFGDDINDGIERILFGQIDDSGARAIRSYIDNDPRGWHEHFTQFFTYISSQKIRTPKGLDWINCHYANLNQNDLMREMEAIRNLHCTLWTEGVREIVSAESSTVKFIISDHPVTVYNYACAPNNEQCKYPNDPSIQFKGTQTLFPLNQNYCLILTNLEYAQDPKNQNPLEKRTNAQYERDSVVRTDAFIRKRRLKDNEVSAINFILKSRSRRYIAASKEEWLYPEKAITHGWHELNMITLPSDNELFGFGGELFVGHKDGSVYYQDAFGRTRPESKHLKKKNGKNEIGRNDLCGCGSGKKFKICCMDIPEGKRPSWDVRSIRERNLILYKGIEDILGLNKGKNWDDVRRELSNDQIVKIHKLYGYLWPIETDIYSLLPRPDNTLRAVYTGLLDPMMVTRFALGAVPYFDEILIQHPFVNPGQVRPEFSPVDNPHKHKLNTLKNLFFFILLEPFVESGVVNFFPDPCCFNNHLQHQLLNMAEERWGNQQINKREAEPYIELQKEDLFRILRMVSKDRQIQMIRQAFPDISQEKLEQLLQYMKEQNEQDPFALLQEDLFDDDGQLTPIIIAPNFEMALFIAQVTGALILTDNVFRWNELKAAQFKINDQINYPWLELSELISNLEFAYSADPEVNFRNRIDGTFGGIRKSLRQIFHIAQQNKFDLEARQIERIKSDVILKHGQTVNAFNKDDPASFSGKMSTLMPQGGFVNNNVQRLLLKSGIEHSANNVPMAIFCELAQ